MNKCEECGKSDFFWHCFKSDGLSEFALQRQPYWGCATCLHCKVMNWFPHPDDRKPKKPAKKK